MDEMFEQIAAGLYSLASMLVGEGEESVRLVETAVATADVSASEERSAGAPEQSAGACGRRSRFWPGAIPTAWRRPPESGAQTCIEDDELDAVGVSSEELERMIAGPDRDRVRKWLASLPPERGSFLCCARWLDLLRPNCRRCWRRTAEPQLPAGLPNAVREIFRQGLCSLASQLLHASTAGRPAEFGKGSWSHLLLIASSDQA